VPVRVGDLGEGLVEHGDVIGGGVRPRPTLLQQPGEGFPGVVQGTEQWWYPKVFFQVRVAFSFSE
jgi:hypothetical protein